MAVVCYPFILASSALRTSLAFKNALSVRLIVVRSLGTCFWLVTSGWAVRTFWAVYRYRRLLATDAVIPRFAVCAHERAR